VTATTETVAGLKKFDMDLEEFGLVEASAYQEFLAAVKREMPQCLGR
jgi:hypothetical protein